jgi:hypothetical protein
MEDDETEDRLLVAMANFYVIWIGACIAATAMLLRAWISIGGL